jgi:hypothetical protein
LAHSDLTWDRINLATNLLYWACLVSLFGSVSVRNVRKAKKAGQTVCFFSAAMKRGFVVPLPFQLKRENQKSHEELGFYAPPLG